MKVGICVPQGWTGEFNGWDPQQAWARTASVARQAEDLGFESIWVFDHFHTNPEPTDELTFEALTALSALASLTRRIRLGQLVLCAGYRNPALVAKMIATIDTISAGRMELGIGAGWKSDEWQAYGYGFPAIRERMAMLSDSLEIITRMFDPGHAFYYGRYFSVKDAINVPKPIQQPRVPIMVGGNGQNVTWRLAAKHADELNLDGMSPDETRDALPIIRARCEEIGRDPSSLRVSVHMWWMHAREAGARRVERLAAYRELGISRVMTLIEASASSDDALESFAADAIEAGVELEQHERRQHL
jgi:F420-dependent oxidoreductase-like protein